MSYIFTNLKAKSQPPPSRNMKSSASDLFKAHIDNMSPSINTKKGIDDYAKKFWDNYKEKPNTPKSSKSPKSPKSPKGAAKKDNTVERKIREKGIDVYIKDLWDDFKKRREGVEGAKSADGAAMAQPVAPTNLVVTQFRRMVTRDGVAKGQSANSDNAVLTQMRGRIANDEGAPNIKSSPTSYNSFVKQHYDKVKKNNPNLKEKNIFEEISKMWKENKLTANIVKSSSSSPSSPSQHYLLPNTSNSTNRFNLYSKYELPEYKFGNADNIPIPTNIAKNRQKSSSLKKSSPRPSQRPSPRPSQRPSPRPSQRPSPRPYRRPSPRPSRRSRSSSDSELDRDDPDYGIKKAFKKLDRQKARPSKKASPKRKSTSPKRKSKSPSKKTPAKASPKK